jgi:hypothetical protein
MFLTPLFMIAAAAGAAIPLFLHLMQTRKRASVPFPTLRFLKEAQKQSARRIRIENFLLWFIRTLIMLLLGTAFAMPILRRKGLAWLGDAPRDVAIVVDSSYSMGYETGRGTVWDKALETASGIVSDLGENDRYCIYLAGEQPEALVSEPINDKQQGLDRISGLAPANTSSRIAPAVAAAAKALRKDSPGRETEIHIITDNQALPWNSFGAGSAAAGDWDPSVLGKDTAVFVSLLGVAAPQNTAPASVELRPEIPRPNSAAEIATTFSRTGSPPPTTAVLFIDGKEVARRPVGDTTTDAAPAFAIPPLAAGVHVGRIETPPDHLPADDVFHFLVRVEAARPSLCVGSPADTLFVRTALQTAAGIGAPPTDLVDPARLAATPLSRYAALFLCNALPLSGQAIGAVERHVRSGGLLVLFPGTSASLTDYSAWSALPTPVAIEDVPRALRRRNVSWDQPTHPIVRALRDGAGVPPLTVRRSLLWGKLPENAKPLASIGSTRPFLIERPFGDGHVLIFAVSADRTWSDFPLSPFYLPLVSQCVDYGAGLGKRTPCHWLAPSLPLPVPPGADPHNLVLLGPDERPSPIRRTLENGSTIFLAEQLATPGIYSLTDRIQSSATPVLAVDLPRDESDLTPIRPETIPERLGIESPYVADDLATLRRLVKDHRVGRSYAEPLLWAAFLLTIAEFSLANQFLRRRSSK